MSIKKSSNTYRALLLNSSYNELPEPIGFQNIPEEAHPYFQEILLSRPCHLWTTVDLQSAVILSSITLKLNQAIEVLGNEVIVTDHNGAQKPHPAIAVVSNLTALRLSAASKLGFNTNTKRTTVTGATHSSVSSASVVKSSADNVKDFNTRLAAKKAKSQ